MASLPAPASLMLDRSSRRLSGAPHAPAKPFDQKLTSVLCAVGWKECIDVSLHIHRYECITSDIMFVIGLYVIMLDGWSVTLL